MTSDPSQPSVDRLALLYRLSQTFNSSLDLDKVLNRVMDEVIAATRAERGFVMLHEPDGRLAFRVARGIDQSTIDDPQFQISRSVVERVAHEGQPVLTGDAQADDRLSMRQSIMILGLRSILCVPLKIKDRISGVVYVDNRLQVGIFGPADLELLTSIASSAAIAIENARLYQVAVEKGRMERELQMAHELQAQLLPRTTPQFPGWEFGACWHPAREVAGDYYDFIPGDRGQLSVVIADVSDKGMHSALFMALTRSIIRASVGHTRSLAGGMARANRLICADSSGGMFVTVFCAVLRPDTGELTYVNAGHNPPLLFRGSEGSAEDPLEKLMPSGMALGIVDDATFEQRTLQLDPGDYLFLYTDGVTDAMEPGGQRFGMDRLSRAILDHRHEPAPGIVNALKGTISGFTQTSAQFDDIAMVLVKRQRAKDG
jgi:sigma-B regulation protein RsbU (phosphoserine phosphatase)